MCAEFEDYLQGMDAEEVVGLVALAGLEWFV